MATFEEREARVFDFMALVQEQFDALKADEDLRNSTNYKLKMLDKCENDAKNICLDELFARIYKDATPLSDDYKNAYADDLDTAFRDFMQRRCPRGMEYYVKEGLKKKSPFAQKALEAVNNLVDSEYKNKAMNIEDYAPEDLVFSTNDDIQKKIDVIGQDLSVPEISQAVNTNVKNTILSEIRRAKEKKNAEKNLELDLANDIRINNPELVESALELNGVKTKYYTPTLFNGILINKMNELRPRYESGELQNVFTYDALVDFGKPSTYEEGAEVQYATLPDLAFIEAVKEYTGWSVLKALRLESFDKVRLNDLANEYAQN